MVPAALVRSNLPVVHRHVARHTMAKDPRPSSAFGWSTVTSFAAMLSVGNLPTHAWVSSSAPSCSASIHSSMACPTSIPFRSRASLPLCRSPMRSSNTPWAKHESTTSRARAESLSEKARALFAQLMSPLRQLRARGGAARRQSSGRQSSGVRAAANGTYSR